MKPKYPIIFTDSDGNRVAGQFVVVPDGSISNGTIDLNAQFDLAVPETSILRDVLTSIATYNNNATLANTALSVSVEAGATYIINMVLHIDSAARDIKVDFGGTATVTTFIGAYVQTTSSDATAVPATPSRVTNAGTDFEGASDGVSSTVIFHGTLIVNAAGTFILRAAQSQADASDTSILVGSSLTLLKV